MLCFSINFLNSSLVFDKVMPFPAIIIGRLDSIKYFSNN
jgi:hypothetical protein